MARFMTGIRVERRVITVPVAQPVTGCVVPTEDECCDGGSGSGTFCEEGCTSTCPACASMAKRWTFLSPGDEAEITLCYLENSNDGNPCTFMSEDMTWRLYLSVLDTWTLENLTTGDLFFLENSEWDCVGLNHMEDALGATAVDVSPVDSCEPMGWDCVDDDCVEEPGGAYPTRQECIDAGCGVIIPDCDDVPIPPEITLTISGTIAYDGTYTLTYDAGLGFWNNDTSLPGVAFNAQCFMLSRWQLVIFNPAPIVYDDPSSTLSPVSATFSINTGTGVLS